METTTTDLNFILERPEEQQGDSGGDSNDNQTNGGGSNGGDSGNQSSNNGTVSYDDSGYYSPTGGSTVYRTDTSNIVVPNTGRHSPTESVSRSDPSLAPIFMALFLVVTLFVVVRTIIKQKKSHRNFSGGNAKLGFTPLQISLVGSSTLALAFLGASLLNSASIKNQKSAEAASSLAISSLGKVEVNMDSHFDVATLGYVAEDIVKVTSTSNYSYHILMQAETDNLYLNGDKESASYFKPVSGSKDTNLIDQDGSWGYHTVQGYADNKCGNTTNFDLQVCERVNWLAVPTTATEIANISAVDSEDNSSTTEVYFGGNPSDNLKNGTYSTKITYTVVSDEPAPEPSPTTYMQDISVSDLSESQTSTLRDKRDNQDYTVYRWPSTGTAGTDYPTGMAGYAIMTKDLSLGYVTGGSVTKDGDLTLSADDSASDGTIIARTGIGTGDWSTTGSDDNLQYINGPQSGQEAYSSHSYYSYGAAQKVCPKGWRLPTKDEYDNIAAFMGGNNAAGSSAISSAPYSFGYGGYFVGGWLAVGEWGRYWSSNQISSTDGYYLAFGSSNLFTGDHIKYIGMSVRCVAETPSDASTVQDCSATVHPTATTGCKMADGRIWIFGNSGNEITWNDMFTVASATDVDGHDATVNSGICPAGYSAPKITDFDTLIQAYGGTAYSDTRNGYRATTDALHSMLGLSGESYFWSSTEYAGSAYVLLVNSGNSASSYGIIKDSSGHALCYK